MNKLLCLDMDGSIAGLYEVENWLEKLRAEDATPYLKAALMWNKQELNRCLHNFHGAGWQIHIITWFAKNSSKAYEKATKEAKLEWLRTCGLPYDSFHGVSYGVDKTSCVRDFADVAVLVDDCADIRNGWNLGAVIDPTAGNLIEKLYALLD
jgi:hypothetical protein